MTEVRQPSFSMDLQGEWMEANSDEEGTLAYLETSGDQAVFVTLLAAKPVYALADRKTLLEQYMHHRSQWERGQIPGLRQSEPAVTAEGESAEGAWSGEEEETGRRVRHRVLLAGALLADFCYETFNMSQDVFEMRAGSALSSAEVTP